MCLGIPARSSRSTTRSDALATAEVGGVRRQVNIRFRRWTIHPPEACIGDWVLLHVGFAMSRIDAAEAARTLGLLAELGELQEARGAEVDTVGALPYAWGGGWGEGTSLKFRGPLPPTTHASGGGVLKS